MEVLLLTQEDCGFCEQAKALLGRLSTELGFSLTILNLDSREGRSLAERGGILFPPGIFIDGEAVCYGRPSERRLRRELERRLREATPDSFPPPQAR